MDKLQSYFKMQLKQIGGKPSIKEVKYIWADGLEYTWLEFEGYASTGELDRGWDITLPMAFAETLKSYMENAMMLLQHDDTKPIWSFTSVTIDWNGLYVKWLVKVDTDNVFQKLRTWVLKTMSIGYRVIDWTTESINDVEAFIIKKLELFEISLVSVPMNAGAKIKSNLSDDEFIKLYQIDKDDNYSLTKSLMDLKEKKVSIDTKDISDSEIEEIKEEVVTQEVITEEKQCDACNWILPKVEEVIAWVSEWVTDFEVTTEASQPIEINEVVPTEKYIEEKGCSKPKKPKTKSLMVNEIMVGDMVRYVENEAGNEWMWDCGYDEEILWDLQEADVWEIIKIVTDKGAWTTIWILKYELTMEWFKPTNEVEMFEFEEIEMMKVSNSQLKSIATKQTIKIEVSEKSAWDIAEKSIDLVSEVKDIKEDQKSIELETKFNEYKENSLKEVKSLFEEESKKFEAKTNEFADILLKALDVLNDTNEKALEYISKLENSPVTKSFRYLEKEVKQTNTFTEMIKSIKK